MTDQPSGKLYTAVTKYWPRIAVGLVFAVGVAGWAIEGLQTGTIQQPRWTRNGTELTYYHGTGERGNIMAAPLRSSIELGQSPLGPPEHLFGAMVNAYAPWFGTFFFDVSDDGERFLVNGVDSRAEPIMHLVVNWEAGLPRLRERMGN